MESEETKPLRWVGASRNDVKTFPRPVKSEPYDGNTWRAVYTVRFEDAVYVLHAFQKKSKTGIATPKKELDLIRKRLADGRTRPQEQA